MNSIVDFIFIDILSAPTADETKVEPTLAKVQRRVSTAVRRASTAVRRASQAIVRAVETKKRSNSRLSIHKTRILPDAAVAAHIAANESAKSIVQSSVERHQTQQKTHSLRRQLAIAGITTKSDRDESATDIASVMGRLQEDVLIQRTQVRKGELLLFDLSWGYILQIPVLF